MKTIFRILPGIACAAAVQAAKPMGTTDPEIFKNPAKAEVEIARLLRREDSSTEYIIDAYSFFPCPQKEGKDFYMLLASYDYIFESSYVDENEYPLEDEEELFPADKPSVASKALHPPGLKRIMDQVVLVFDHEGREVRPFGGNNLIHPGYVLDAQADGILDRADSTNYGLKEAKGQHVEVFELTTIEKEPTELLQVIFNWHPHSAGDLNEWAFHCFDEEEDGLIEIAFGPEGATTVEEQRKVIFRWDSEAGEYSTGELPEGSHVRVLKPGEKLSDLAKSGGIGYPLIEADGEKAEEDPTPANPPEPAWSPFEPTSLKDTSDKEMAAFFQGKKRKDTFRSTPDDPKDPQETTLPDGFWKMDPKQAALALADANRTAKHRERWQLAVDDRGGIQPPTKGWLVHDWGSSSCYSYSSNLHVLRHGDHPVLIVFGYNSVGVVGRNPWADQPAHNARLIPLTKEEATFLSDTLFWLDRIRSHDSLGDDERSSGGSSSTADGSAIHDRHPHGETPRRVSSTTVWVDQCVAGHWDADYNREIFTNLANHLFANALQAKLGERWNVTESITPQNLVTPDSDRMHRGDADARQQLADTYRDILEINRQSPLPCRATAHLVSAAGDERFTEFLPEFEDMLLSLPPENAEDAELKKLQQRMRHDHFGGRLEAERDDDEQAQKRLDELQKKHLFMEGTILRKPLSTSVERLRMAKDPARLMQEVIDRGELAQWALKSLHRIDPEGWSDLVSDDFLKGDVETRRSILSTLSTGHPPAAAKLIAGLTDEERGDLSSEIVRFHRAHDPSQLDTDQAMLLTLIKNPKADFIRRGEAMGLLAECQPTGARLAEFEALLLKEVADPQEGVYGMDTGDSAIAALLKLPDATKHLDFLISRQSRGYREYEMMLKAILRLEPDKAKQQAALKTVVGRQLEDSPGFMNNVFLACLVHDLRELEPKLRSMATMGPEVRDGDGANYSGGNFKGPEGQHYHLAREIVSLWHQEDEQTQARMWCYLATSHPFEFDTSRHKGERTKQLRRSVAAALEQFPIAEREQMVNAARQGFPIPSHCPEVDSWLDTLTQP